MLHIFVGIGAGRLSVFRLSILVAVRRSTVRDHLKQQNSKFGQSRPGGLVYWLNTSSGRQEKKWVRMFSIIFHRNISRQTSLAGIGGSCVPALVRDSGALDPDQPRERPPRNERLGYTTNIVRCHTYSAFLQGFPSYYARRTPSATMRAISHP